MLTVDGRFADGGRWTAALLTVNGGRMTLYGRFADDEQPSTVSVATVHRQRSNRPPSAQRPSTVDRN